MKETITSIISVICIFLAIHVFKVIYKKNLAQERVEISQSAESSKKLAAYFLTFNNWRCIDRFEYETVDEGKVEAIMVKFLKFGLDKNTNSLNYQTLSLSNLYSHRSDADLSFLVRAKGSWNVNGKEGHLSTTDDGKSEFLLNNNGFSEQIAMQAKQIFTEE